MANERKNAIDHPTFPKSWPNSDGMDDAELVSYAIKTLPEVVKGLLVPYQDELYITQGYTYIPWEQSAAHLNEVFGFFGWITKEVSRREVHRTYERWDSEKNKLVEVAEDGVEAVICLTVRARLADGSIIEKPIENVGYAKMLNTDKGADTAVKAARSDALSRACKLLGDSFGLYLYEKPEETPRQNNYPPRTNTPPTTNQPPRSTPPPQANGAKPLTDKQIYKLTNGVGLTAEEVARLEELGVGKAAVDAAFKGWSGDTIRSEYLADERVAF